MSQADILELLTKTNRPMSVAEISSNINITASATYINVKRLMKSKFIEKTGFVIQAGHARKIVDHYVVAEDGSI